MVCTPLTRAGEQPPGMKPGPLQRATDESLLQRLGIGEAQLKTPSIVEALVPEETWLGHGGGDLREKRDTMQAILQEQLPETKQDAAEWYHKDYPILYKLLLATCMLFLTIPFFCVAIGGDEGNGGDLFVRRTFRMLSLLLAAAIGALIWNVFSAS